MKPFESRGMIRKDTIMNAQILFSIHFLHPFSFCPIFAATTGGDGLDLDVFEEESRVVLRPVDQVWRYRQCGNFIG